MYSFENFLGGSKYLLKKTVNTMSAIFTYKKDNTHNDL